MWFWKRWQDSNFVFAALFVVVPIQEHFIMDSVWLRILQHKHCWNTDPPDTISKITIGSPSSLRAWIEPVLAGGSAQHFLTVPLLHRHDIFGRDVLIRYEVHWPSIQQSHWLCHIYTCNAHSKMKWQAPWVFYQTYYQFLILNSCVSLVYCLLCFNTHCFIYNKNK